MWFESLLVFILFKFKKRPNISGIRAVWFLSLCKPLINIALSNDHLVTLFTHVLLTPLILSKEVLRYTSLHTTAHGHSAHFLLQHTCPGQDTEPGRPFPHQHLHTLDLDADLRCTHSSTLVSTVFLLHKAIKVFVTSIWCQRDSLDKEHNQQSFQD